MEKRKVFFPFSKSTKQRWVFPDEEKRMHSMAYQSSKKKTTLEIVAFINWEQDTYQQFTDNTYNLKFNYIRNPCQWKNWSLKEIVQAFKKREAYTWGGGELNFFFLFLFFFLSFSYIRWHRLQEQVKCFHEEYVSQFDLPHNCEIHEL